MLQLFSTIGTGIAFLWKFLTQDRTADAAARESEAARIKMLFDQQTVLHERLSSQLAAADLMRESLRAKLDEKDAAIYELRARLLEAGLRYETKHPETKGGAS